MAERLRYGADIRRIVAAMTERDVLDLAWLRQAVSTGEAVRIREDSGTTQGEAARAVGVAAPTLSRWESRQRVPTGLAAVRYARLLRKLQQQSAVPA